MAAQAVFGPYFPDAFLSGFAHELCPSTGNQHSKPLGKEILLMGRVLDGTGESISNVLIEFWQANAHGHYQHKYTPPSEKYDPWFKGFARQFSGNGHYCLRSIKPGGHRSENDLFAASIHTTVCLAGHGVLSTQIYFADEADNARDPVLQSAAPENQRRLVAQHYGCRGDGVEVYWLDIIIDHKQGTPFYQRNSLLCDKLYFKILAPRPPLHTLPKISAGENDLCKVTPHSPTSSGTKLRLIGEMVDIHGEHMPNALVEWWQCDQHGRFNHREDRSGRALDPYFRGWGRTLSNEAGGFDFRIQQPNDIECLDEQRCHGYLSVLAEGVRMAAAIPLTALGEGHIIYPGGGKLHWRLVAIS